MRKQTRREREAVGLLRALERSLQAKLRKGGAALREIGPVVDTLEESFTGEKPEVCS